MKKISRGIAILLCICMVLGMLPATVLAADGAGAISALGGDTIVYDALFMSDLHNGVGGYPGLKQMVSELQAEGLNPRVVSHGGDYVEDDRGGEPNWQTQVYDVISGVEKAAFPNASLAFTMGNHDWESGTFGGNRDKEAAFKDVFGFARTGLAYSDDEMEIYMIGAQGTTGAGGGGETFIQADIDAFDQYLNTVQDSGKVVFLQTHWPAHSSFNFKQRVVNNADKLIDVMNKYGDSLDLVWIWGHNHYEDEMRYVILQPGDQLMYKADTSGSSWGNPRNPEYKTIKFTYANAGCMNDMWYLHDGHNDTNASINYRGPSACLSVAVDNGAIHFQYNRIQQINNEWVFAHDATLRIYNHNVTKEHPAEVTVTRLTNSHTHDYKAGAVVAPSCVNNGYTIYTCSICGASYQGDEVAAPGHSYAEGYCTVCGAKDPNYHAPIENGFTIDFTKAADADKYTIDFPADAAVTEGEGLKMSSTTANFEAAGDAFAPVDVIKVPVSGNFIATMKFSAVPGSTFSFGGDTDILGFYAMEDYQNGVGMRAGNNSIANLSRKNGAVLTGDADVGAPVTTGFTTNATNWFRIEKSGEDYFCSVSTDGETFTEIFCFADTGITANYLVIDAYKTTTWSFGGNNAYTFAYMDVEDGGPDKVKPEIASLQVNGKDVGFDKRVRNYNVEVAKSSTKAPVITAVPANAATTIEISEMDGPFGTAYITASAAGRSVVYSVSCNYGPEDDYFADGDMSSNWSILNEVAEPTEERPWTYHRMEEGVGLVLPTQKGSIYMAKQADPQGPWTNVFLMPAQGDWEIITKSFYPQLPKDIYQQTQVFAWQDEDHYIRINCQYNAQQNLRVEPANEIGSGTFNILNVTYANPNEDNTATLYYKINKSGTTYNVSYSTDCKTWVDGGTVENLNYIDPKFGLFCTQDDGNDNYIELSFEYVAVTSKNGTVVKTEDEVLQWAAQNAANYMAEGLPAETDEALAVKAPHGYAVEFVSGNPDVIAADGTVTPAKNNTKVQVSVKVTEGDVTATSAPVTVNVKGTDPDAQGYVLADSIQAGKQYVIVSNGYAMTNNVSGAAVTVEGNAITSEVTPDMVWTFNKGASTVCGDYTTGYFLTNGDSQNVLARGSSGGSGTAPLNYNTYTLSSIANKDYYGYWIVRDLDDAGNKALFLYSNANETEYVWAMRGGSTFDAPGASQSDLDSLCSSNPLKLYELEDSAASALKPGPNVIKDPTSPTGYTVKFLYQNEQATSVTFAGDIGLKNWNDPTDNATYTPFEYRPGLLRGASFTAPMEKLTEGEYAGWWYYELPLTAGANQYWFYVNGNTRRMMPDPNNAPIWSPNSSANKNAYNAVYVPYDEKQESESLKARTYENPRAEGDRKGTWSYVPIVINERTHYMGVYLPYGYNAEREEPYKLIYILHGGGQDESDWMGIGSVQNILDNLIAEGRTEPAVLVSVTTNNSCIGNKNSQYGNLFNFVIPFIEENYNVSSDPMNRSFGGLSMGCTYTQEILNIDAAQFGYYGAWSNAVIVDPAARNLNKAHILFSRGRYDTGAAANMEADAKAKLEGTGAYYKYIELPGAHDFNTWCQIFRIYCEEYLWNPEAFGDTGEVSHVHSYTAAITAPTCTTAGFTTYTCDCGDSYVADEVAALGHNYVNGVCTRCGEKQPHVGPIKVGCIGDSITYGHNPADGGRTQIKENWPKVLGDLLGSDYEVRNFGQNGTTLMNDGQIVYRNQDIYTQSLAYEADIYIFMLGTNDSNPAQNWNKQEAFKEQMIDLIGTYQALPSKPQIYVCTSATAFHDGNFSIRPYNIHDYIVPLQREVADELGLPVIDIHELTAPYPEMFPDEIHPNEAGCQLIAQEVYAALTTPIGHEHTWTQSVVAPTCLDRGYTASICEECGATRKSNYVDPLGHDWDDGIVTVEATAEAPGVMTYTCKRCDATKTKRIPRIGATVPDDIDFKDPASASQFEIVNKDVTAIREGEGLYMITTKDGFEPANGQLTGDQATTPKDLVIVPVDGDWQATLKFDFSTAGASNGYYQFFGFYAMEDYQNCAGIRGGDGALQNFLRVGGEVTADSADVNSTPGLASNGTYWFRIVKEGTDYTCYRSSDGEEFTEMFAYTETGIEADKIAIDAYTGMTEGYTFMLDTLRFEDVGGDLPHVHQYAAVVTAPTCTEAGYTTYTCDCGESYVADEVAALGHDWDAGIVTKQATATEAGVKTYTCSRCDATRTEEIPALGGGYFVASKIQPGKTYVIVANDSLAITNAVTAKAVTVAGGKLTGEVTEDMLWNFKDVSEVFADSPAASNGSAQFFIFAATKDTDNFLQRGSGSGGESTAAIVQVAAFPNTARWSRWSFEPRADGSYTMYVNTEREHTSDYAFTLNVSEYDINCTNSYGPWDDLTASGSSIRLYELAGDVAHEHKYTATVTAPTCTAKGFTTYTCACGDSYVADEVAALGHDVKEAKVDATCTAAGSITKTCSRCDYKEVTEIAALGHDLKETTVAATCTAAGSVTTTCARCDYQTVTEITALGHDFVDGTCTRCGEKEEVPYVNPFEDVKEGTFYYNAVEWAVKNNITNGIADNTFAPANTVTRGQIVTFLWRAAGCPEPEAEATFTDLKAGAFYSKAVAWAVEKGITQGITKDKFAPDSICTRGQIVTFLWRYMEKPAATAPAAFTDLKAGAFYVDAVAWAVEAGVTDGITDELFKPDNACTRGQAVTFIQRAVAK